MFDSFPTERGYRISISEQHRQAKDTLGWYSNHTPVSTSNTPEKHALNALEHHQQ